MSGFCQYGLLALYSIVQRNRGNQQNGKTRNLFRKLGDIKGTFYARMGKKKDRNGKDLTEAEEIKK